MRKSDSQRKLLSMIKNIPNIWKWFHSIKLSKKWFTFHHTKHTLSLIIDLIQWQIYSILIPFLFIKKKNCEKFLIIIKYFSFYGNWKVMQLNIHKFTLSTNFLHFPYPWHYIFYIFIFPFKPIWKCLHFK